MSWWVSASSTSLVVRPGWASPCWLSGSWRPRGSRGCRPSVVRTVLRRVLAELDAADQDPVDAAQLAELMYPHIEQMAEVCVEEAERFLIEGFELSPWYRGRLGAALAGTRVRACFLGHSTFSADDLASYRGPKPQHEGEASRAELTEAAAWIRRRSHQLRGECRDAGLPYVDVGALGFEAAMQQARRHLIGCD